MRQLRERVEAKQANWPQDEASASDTPAAHHDSYGASSA
jgi:hypothetical protein